MIPDEVFLQAWQRTHAAEKGYSNHPNDPGGETNHGVTARVARAHGYTGPMRELPFEKATDIAKAEFWDRHRFGDVAAMSNLIAFELFDTGFNMWEGAAGKFLQRALNALNRQGRDYADLNVDGRIGNVTLLALRTFLAKRGKDGETVMLRCLNAQQCADYLRQCGESVGKEDFFYGWVLNRVQI